MSYSIAKVSTKGQIVIPESIRKQQGLKYGDFVYLVPTGSGLLLQAVSPPRPNTKTHKIIRKK